MSDGCYFKQRRVFDTQCVLRRSIVFLFHVLLVLAHWPVQISHSAYSEGKAVPLQAWTGPEGSRKLRFPDFVTTAQDGGRLSALSTGRFLPPGNTSGTHFCYRLSRPQGHSAIGRILCQSKIHWYHLESNQRPSDL
jgi:hypothetical protein